MCTWRERSICNSTDRYLNSHVYVCIYLYIYTRMHVYSCTCMQKSIHTYVYIGYVPLRMPFDCSFCILAGAYQPDSPQRTVCKNN